jgi:tetrapyrrole methylase family protein/MazG family protein
LQDSLKFYKAPLRRANERFYRRFSYMEQVCKKKGIALESLPLEKQDELWEEAKRELKD